MSLTPDDIEHVSFKRELRGYAEEEVDLFLDRVHARLSELLRDRDDMRQQIVEVERRAAESAEAEVLLKRTLIAAQRTADDTVEEARRTAEAAVAEARELADHTVGEAKAEAEHTLAEARAESQRVATAAREESERLVSQATAEAERLLTDTRQRASAEYEAAREAAERTRRAVEELRRFRGEYRDRVRAVIAEQLDVLDRIGDLPEPPGDLDDLQAQAEELAAAARRTQVEEPDVGDL